MVSLYFDDLTQQCWSELASRSQDIAAQVFDLCGFHLPPRSVNNLLLQATSWACFMISLGFGPPYQGFGSAALGDLHHAFDAALTILCR